MTRLILDGNSLLNAALLGGKDEEFGFEVVSPEGKKTYVNGHQHGVDKFFEEVEAVCREFDAAPRQMILCWDGKNAKARRQTLLPTYKTGRDKIPEVNEQLNKARELVTKQARDLGMTIAVQLGYEGDDIIGYLVKTLRNERNIIITSDGDLSVLVDENTSIWRLGQMDANPYGPFPHKFITLYKALVGDTSDKIPGAKGFGDTAWCDLVRTFGLEGLEMMEGLIIEGKLATLVEDVGSLKSLQKIIDSAAMVTTSWNVARLLIEDINTMRKPLELQAGMVKQWGESDDQHPQLKRFYGTKTLVTAENYDAVYERLANQKFIGSPFVSLDIETSTSEESDEWIAAKAVANGGKGGDKLDVLGSELTGASLTFGSNTQHTIYMAVDHKDTANITSDQCRQVVELVPQELLTVIQNRAFEFAVLYRAWGEAWKDNGWSGFVPNAIDTQIGASYVDENLKKGLKFRSLHHLGYEQVTYEQVTTKHGRAAIYGEDGSLIRAPDLAGGNLVSTYNKVLAPAIYELVDKDIVHEDTGEIMETVKVPGTKVIEPAILEAWEARQYKMRELTGPEVCDYGCDDTICTAAVHTFYQLVMEIENTWNTYMEVEQLPQYLTSLAYVQGLPLNLNVINEMSKRDDAAYDKAWVLLRSFLISKGWEGTECPEFEGDIEPSDVKLALSIIAPDVEFSTKKRKLNGIAADIREQLADNGKAIILADIVESNNVSQLNTLVKGSFTGEPAIKFGSPKQMQNLFYRVLKITPRLVNKMTDKQRKEDPVMVAAFKKRNAIKKGKAGLEYSPEELEALISKSSTDDTAVDTALANDTFLSDESKAILKAYKVIKEVMTRRSLFYVPYRALPHWRDGLAHPSLNQAEAVTRRYSANDPNVQQQPSHGDGVELRRSIPARHQDHIVVSLDFNGQELRIQADQSGDEALTSCYVGDNLRDVHTLTAVSAAILVFGKDITYDQFKANLKSEDPVVAEEASKTRKDAKTTNFAAAYGAMADTVAIGLKSDSETAQQFLDARSAAFPGLGVWAEKERAFINEFGFAVTMMGARRHLREAILSDNSWDRAGAERQGVNHKIQGSAGEQTKLAMARMWKAGLFTGKYDAYFYFPVHDEVVFSVHKDHAADLIREAHELMVMPYADMKIPIVSTITVGKSFLCEIEIGNVPDLALIKKALDKIFHPEKQEEKEAA